METSTNGSPSGVSEMPPAHHDTTPFAGWDRGIRGRPAAIGAALMLVLTVTAGSIAQAASDPVAARWQILAEGLETAHFPLTEGAITVLRIDPERWETVALAASAIDDRTRSAGQWGTEFGLVAVVNAGMYAVDHLTHTGYFRTGEHVNNGLWNQRDYRQAACFEPRAAGLPRFALLDLDRQAEDTFAHQYEIVVQNLRLIRKPGENRWQPQERRWSEVCLGEDDQGRMLWIFSPQPRSMHRLNEVLLGLPIGLVAAQHLEGGAEAQLWLDPQILNHLDNDRRDELQTANGRFAWAVPNVLGIKPRPSTQKQR